MDHDFDSRNSSPDPLAFSYDDSNHPISSNLRLSSPTRGRALSETSLNKRSPTKPQSRIVFRRQTQAGARLESSTTKLITMHTPNSKGKGSSPLKIRVTVETDEVTGSPTRKRTRTTKVPLNDEAGPLRRNTRARKSEIDVAETETPSQSKKRKRQDIPEKRKQQRRKSGFVSDILERNVQLKELDTSQQPLDNSILDDISITQSTVHAPQIQSNENKQARKQIDFSALTPLHKKPATSNLLKTPMLDHVPLAIQAKSLKGRIPTPRKPIGWIEPYEADDDNHAEETIEGIDSDNENLTAAIDIGDIDLNTTTLNRSAVESEGFSMVSFESLRSHKDKADRKAAEANGPELVRQQERQEASAKTTIPSHVYPVQIEQHDSMVDSSFSLPPIPPSSSQKHSSPLKEMHSSAVEAGVALQHAVDGSPVTTSSGEKNKLFAGFGDGTRRDLRGGLLMGELLGRSETGFGKEAVSFSQRSSAIRDSPCDSSASKLQTTYPRLPTPAESDSSAAIAISSHDQDSRLRTTRTSQDVIEKQHDEMSWRQSTLPRQAYDEMSWKITTPPHGSNYVEREVLNSEQLNDKFQRERDDIVRQAQEMSESQMIVISSSPPYRQHSPAAPGNMASMTMQVIDKTEDRLGFAKSMGAILVDDDIWQGEVDRSLEDSMDLPRPRVRERQRAEVSVTSLRAQADQAKAQTKGLSEPTLDLRDLLGEDTRPPRSKLPRTWRRASGENSFLYSDESSLAEPSQITAKKAAYKSPGETIEEEGSPTVFARWAGKRTAVRESNEPLKGILSSPNRSRDSSPVKEVHFANIDDQDVALRPSELDETYYSSGASTPPSSRSSCSQNSVDDRESLDDQPEECSSPPKITTAQVQQKNSTKQHKTSHDPFRNTSFSQTNSNLASSQNDASNVRQLKTELHGITTQLDLSLPTDSEDTSEQYSGILSRRGKSYKPLFADPVSTNKSTIAAPTPASAPGFLKRMTSWLFTSPAFGAPSFIEAPHIISNETALPPPDPITDPTWTRNHYLLLDHIYRLSQHHPSSTTLPPRGPAMPSAYHARLPDSYTRFVNLSLTSQPRCIPTSVTRKQRRRSRAGCTPDCPGLPNTAHARTYSAVLAESDVRVAHAFVQEALDWGVPLLCDGSFAVGEGRGKWPRRDGKGRVVRSREDWRGNIEDVVMRVFSLWVGDRMREE